MPVKDKNTTNKKERNNMKEITFKIEKHYIFHADMEL